MLGGGGDVVVVLTGEAQFGAVTLVHNVPELFGGERLEDEKKQKKKKNTYSAGYQDQGSTTTSA